MITKNIFLSLIVTLTLIACNGGDTSTTTPDDVGEGDVSFPEDIQAPQLNFTPVVIEAISLPAFTLYGDSAVLERGSTWDDTFVGPSTVVFHGGLFHMFYNGGTKAEGQLPTERFGYAVSQDGYQWLRAVDGPMLLVAETDYAFSFLTVSSALVEPDGTWVLYLTVWLEGSLLRSAVGRATASDPTGPWTLDKSLALRTDSPERWDGNRVFAPYVIRTETGYIMYYSGVDVDPRNSVLQIGMATSTDGITWTKHDDPVTTGRLYIESDPIFGVGLEGTWDEISVSNPRVLRTKENWVMLYIGSMSGSFSEDSAQVGYATSLDGIIWERYEGNPVLSPLKLMPGFNFGDIDWIYHDNTHFLYFGAFNLSFITQEIYLATSE